jgi:hypothetical protein
MSELGDPVIAAARARMVMLVGVERTRALLDRLSPLVAAANIDAPIGDDEDDRMVLDAWTFGIVVATIRLDAEAAGRAVG